MPFKVKAIAAYTPSSATELPLVVGQIYEVTSTDGKGVWVQSKVNGVVGWFPFSYTQVIPNEPAAAAPPPQQSRPMTSSSNTATPATPAATATPAASTPATQVKPAAAPKVEKKEKPTKPGPALKTHIEKNKANLPTTVLVHGTRLPFLLILTLTCPYNAHWSAEQIVPLFLSLFLPSASPPEPRSLLLTCCTCVISYFFSRQGQVKRP